MGRIVCGAPRKKPLRNAQAVRVGNIIFTSGVALDWDTGEFVGDSIEEQTKQSMGNIKTTLEACGSSLQNIDKCTVFVTKREHVPGMNDVYYSYFSDTPPARACIIAELAIPKMMVEIEVIAHVDEQ